MESESLSDSQESFGSEELQIQPFISTPLTNLEKESCLFERKEKKQGICMKDFDLIKKLGQGAYGQVLLGKKKITN